MESSNVVESDIHHVSNDLCSYPIRNGNTVIPLIDSRATYERICEVIDKANHSVWVVVSFIGKEFQFPENRGNFFDLMDSCYNRGLDVRVLFWCNSKFTLGTSYVFNNSDENLQYLKKRNSKFFIRWDDSDDKPHCHHEKTWLIDAGYPTETIFTGGIVISGYLASPSHTGFGEQKHDIMCQLTGPAGSDVHHSFVQRWNEALYHDEKNGCWPNIKLANNLNFPAKISTETGNARVQVQRTIRSKFITNSHPAVHGVPFNISDGEASILQQYIIAIKSAKDTIYIENQHIAHEYLLDLLMEALERNVEVIYLVPGQPMNAVVHCQKQAVKWLQENNTSVAPPRYSSIFLEKLPKLKTYRNFSLCALAVWTNENKLEHLYVHSKLMIVDQKWFTVGSANFVDISFEKDHTELNISVWDEKTSRELFYKLIQEHIDIDLSNLNGKQALIKFREIALKNRENFLKNEKLQQGHVFVINPETYATNQF